MGTRLRAYLMRTGEFKRSAEVVRLVESGKVSINGKVITNPEFHIGKKDVIEIKGLGIGKPRPLVYIIFNKPVGYVCQKTNKEKSIYGLIDEISEIDKETKKTLFCVGRLDKDTEGLLIVTNDGKLSDRLTKPGKSIYKTYFVETEKAISSEDLKKLEKGVEIQNVDTKEKFSVRALKTKLLSEKQAEITIDEGKKRQVRLMFETIGNNVVHLKRIGIGSLKIEDLDNKGYAITPKEHLEKKLFK